MTLVVYLPVLQNDWQWGWDDAEMFKFNSHFRGLGWANIKWAFQTHRMGAWMPATWLSFELDYVLWGMDPRGYHLINAVWHALSAGLVFLLGAALYTRGDPPRANEMTLIVAAVVAVAWAWHPLRVESVAWLSERKDVLCGSFYLLTVLLYFRTAESSKKSNGDTHDGKHEDNAARRTSIHRYLLCLGCFVLALLSKPMAVSLPAVLLILDRYDGRRSAQARLEKIPFLCLALASCIYTWWTVRQVSLMPTLDDLSIPARIGLSVYGIAFYLGKTLWPWPLLPMYQLNGVINFGALDFLVGYVVVLGITVAAVALRRRYQELLTAWVVCIVILLPVLNLAQNGPQLVADRYTYLASIPLVLLVGGMVKRWL